MTECHNSNVVHEVRLNYFKVNFIQSREIDESSIGRACKITILNLNHTYLNVGLFVYRDYM